MYWLGSNRTLKDLKISLGLFATVNILMIGGLQDLMFFTFWTNGLPPDNVVWWWTRSANSLEHGIARCKSLLQYWLVLSLCYCGCTYLENPIFPDEERALWSSFREMCCGRGQSSLLTTTSLVAFEFRFRVLFRKDSPFITIN